MPERNLVQEYIATLDGKRDGVSPIVWRRAYLGGPPTGALPV